MRNFYFLFVLVFLISFNLYSQDKDFILGFEGGLPGPHNGSIPWDWYEELHCNFFLAWYTESFDQYPGMPSQIQYSFFQPPYLHTRSWSQQTIYQAEATDASSDSIFKYKYNTHWSGSDLTDNSQHGSGARVRYYTGNPSSPAGGYILEDTDEWFEQSGSIIWWYTNLKYEWHRTEGTNSGNTWFIKPRMRIDPTFAVNNPNTEVVRIEVYSWNGTKVKEVILRCRHFIDGSGNYNGSYLEEFNYQPGDSTLDLTANNTSGGLNYGRNYDNGPWPEHCGVDFKIHWYGYTDVWIDYVRVDDFYANELFKGTYDPILEDEMEELLSHQLSGKFTGIFTEEFQMNNMNGIKYINDKMAQWFPNDERARVYSLLNDHTFDWVETNTQSQAWPYGKYLNKINPKYLIINNNYQFWQGQPWMSNYWLPPNIQVPNLHTQMGISQTEYEEVYDAYIDNKASTYSQYNNYLQEDVLQPWSDTCRKANDTTLAFGIDYWIVPQLHHWENAGNQWMREPLNEEFESVCCVALSNGAKGILPYTYESLLRDETSPGSGNYKGTDFGMFDFGGIAPNPVDNHYNGRDIGSKKRIQNFYGQYKWDFVKSFYHKVKTWGPILSNSSTTKGYSVHRDGADHEFITDIVSIAPYIGGVNSCEEDGPSTYTDCEEERYWEMGFFYPDYLPANDRSKYFMMVNRRCVPEVEGEDGDHRQLKIKFDAAGLPGYDNWKIVDVYTNQSVTFNKNYTGAINLGTTDGSVGWFNPGEGKLFKLTPVVVDGGTLVSDEVINDDALISDTVFTDGFNLTIEDGSTVTFDTNGVIVAQGGNFICGDISGTHGGVNLIGASEWKGIKLISCDTVKIYNTSIEDIKDSSYAVDMFNCKNVEMEGNTFTLDNSGAVRGSYILSFEFFTPNIVLYDNTVNIGGNTLPVFNFNANSASSFPVIIDDCVMNSPSSSSSSAISITNISGGVIKNNEITGYNMSVLALSSAMDFYNNIISSSTTDCILSGSSGSTLGLKETGGKGTGGENFFSTSHEDANNVEIYGGYFFAEDGYNTFDIAASYDDGKHFSGYFATEDEFTPSLEYNCFTEDGSPISPVYDVTWGFAGDPVSFDYTYDCTAGEGAGFSSKSENNYLIVPITDRYNDTIKIRDGNFTLTASDSMSVEMRKRNYNVTIGIAERILENSPGSPIAYDAISKLYLASLRLDSAGSKMTPLKAFLEEVILDNGDKPGLVSRAFYFIQKCKAALGQYQSALTGFGDIITNNPNTYDALVASWDYAATALLLNGGNSGGSRNAVSINNGQLSIDNNESVEKLYELKSNSDDPDDRSKLTKEQKQQVKVNVVKSFEETRKEEINVINKLKEKSDRGDRNATKELKRRETLQAVVTKRQPADIYEHINNVSSDIRVVFNSTNDNSIKKEQNSIPLEFELSQNFPNPFNPTTKIQYALPKDGKVQLVIYDILGREMAKLVNNEFKSAGRYVSEFNGSRLASGIYFYRIIVNDGKDFNSVKKMVLIK